MITLLSLGAHICLNFCIFVGPVDRLFFMKLAICMCTNIQGKYFYFLGFRLIPHQILNLKIILSKLNPPFILCNTNIFINQTKSNFQPFSLTKTNIFFLLFFFVFSPLPWHNFCHLIFENRKKKHKNIIVFL